MPSTPAIDFDNISRQFGDVTALQDLDLTVERGEIYGFLGPNGAGKSTAINILLGFLPPTDGQATVLGYDTQTESTTLRHHLGVLPEGYQVYERLTGREHLEVAAASKGATPEYDRLLDRVGIREAADRKAGTYSKGMTQRLVFGMALVGDPELLILDEPSSGLDPNGVRILQHLRQRADGRLKVAAVARAVQADNQPVAHQVVGTDAVHLDEVLDPHRAGLRGGDGGGEGERR